MLFLPAEYWIASERRFRVERYNFFLAIQEPTGTPAPPAVAQEALRRLPVLGCLQTNRQII